MSLLVLVEFKTRADGEATFLRVAKALAAEAATEPGTLRYQWCTTQKPGHYSIIEEYVDADAAETHNHHVEPLLRELFGVADLVSIQFFGALNKYLRDWSTGREGVTVNTPL
ncbi:antibiotic biosynthesis monooxygenase [Myxococcus stipitatus]|uniref:putative quinol monooxygenase n=1 Tax=Myxococcus stipitatus TaxID=83455 RepID=UPI003145473D